MRFQTAKNINNTKNKIKKNSGFALLFVLFNCFHANAFAQTQVQNSVQNPASNPEQIKSAKPSKPAKLRVIPKKILPDTISAPKGKEVASPYIQKSSGLLVIENGKATPVHQTPLGKTDKTSIQQEEVLTEYLTTMSGAPVKEPKNAPKPILPKTAKDVKDTAEITKELNKDKEIQQLRSDIGELKAMVKALADDKHAQAEAPVVAQASKPKANKNKVK